MLLRRQENFRWEKKVRRSNEMKLSSTCKLNGDPFTHTEDIAAAPSFMIIDENDDEYVSIED